MKIRLFTILIFALSFIGCTNENDIIKDNSTSKQSIETILETTNYESLNNFENSFKIEKTISKEEYEKIKLIQKKALAKLYDIE